MTTIVLSYPNQRSPRYHVFGEYEAAHEHYVFAVAEIGIRREAEYVARHMMEAYEADHFRREIEVGGRIG